MSWTPPNAAPLPDPQDFLYRGTLDELLDVLLELQAVGGGYGVTVVGELEEGVGQARVARLVQAALLAQPAGDGPQTE
jgi:hypothetical protein